MAAVRKPIWTWKNALLAGLALVAATALVSGYSIYRTVTVVIPHSYAAWTTGDLLVEFMQTHDNQWPRGWKDLENAKDSLVVKGRNIYYDFHKLPSIVKIDWTVDPAVLAAAALTNGESAVVVVTRLDGSKLDARWGPDTEPNRKVALHLIQLYGPSHAMEPQKSPSSTNLTLP